MLQCTGLETVGCGPLGTAFMRLWACEGALPGIKAEGCLSIVHEWAVSFSGCGLFNGVALRRKCKTAFTKQKSVRRRRRSQLSHIELRAAHGREAYVVILLFLRLLVALWSAVVAGGLDAHHIAVPRGRTHRGEPEELVI